MLEKANIDRTKWVDYGYTNQQDLEAQKDAVGDKLTALRELRNKLNEEAWALCDSGEFSCDYLKEESHE